MLLSEQCQASIHHLWIVKRPARTSNLLQRNFYPQTGSIRTVRGHCLDYIGYADNACFKQNMIAFESLWITRTIHPLMVLQHHLCNGPREVNTLQNVISSLSMGLDQAVFKISDFARLAEYFRGNLDFTQIMHHAGEMD